MHAHRAAALGILYAEDFGNTAPPPAAPPAALQPAAGPLTSADVEAACHRAVALARTDWAASVETRRTAALETLAAGLAEAREAAEEAAEAVADGVARTALSMLAGLLPNLSRRHGDAEVRVLLQAMLPLLAAQRSVVVRVHAGLIEALEHDFAAFDEELAARIELRPGNLPPGDARLAWEDGSLVRDAAVIHQALTDALSRLGLLERDLATTPIGVPALAQ